MTAEWAKFPNNLAMATIDLIDHLDDFDREFKLFFPDLIKRVEEWSQENHS